MVMNLIVIDISGFFGRIVYLLCSKKCSFLFGTYFAQNIASKINQCLVPRDPQQCGPVVIEPECVQWKIVMLQV